MEKTRIRLVRPEEKHREAALAFRQEFFTHGETVIDGSELLDRTEGYDAWLESIRRNVCPDTVSPDWVLTDTYFAVDEDGQIVGIIDLRHELNDFLRDLGHCGYSVRPTARRKGYGAEMLRLLKQEARKAGMTHLQMSVMPDNTPSVKIIRGAGGVWQRSFVFAGQTADIYTIDL